jgi:hypothetical protein
MKIKVGKLETPYHKMQLKFAGLESLMTQDLQEQLIQPAISHKTPKNSPADMKAEEQLNEEMSALMAQREKDGNAPDASTPVGMAFQKVKRFM